MPPYGLAGIKDPTAVWRNTPKFAREMLGKTFLWWYWGIYLFLKIFGFELLPAFFMAIASVVIFCMSWGFIKARQVAREALKAGPAGANAMAGSSVSQPVLTKSSRPRPVSITTADPIIGNRALNIYHLTNCEWVNRILNKNRVTFATPFEASTAGYKPCRICSPSGY